MQNSADGAITTPKFKSSALAPDADELDGIDSTGFLGINAKAADSEKLDNLELLGLRASWVVAKHVYEICIK